MGIPTSLALQVLIHDENGMVFEGTAAAVSAVNEKGPFAIVYKHSDFISVISQHVTIHAATGTTKKYPVVSGVLRCFNSKVEVYLGVDAIEIGTS